MRGSRGDTYKLEFEFTRGRLRASCNCAAGRNKLNCKHRLAILAGDTAALTSSNSEDVTRLLDLLRGSEVENAVQAVQHAQRSHDIAKTQLDSAKKSLERIMLP